MYSKSRIARGLAAPSKAFLLSRRIGADDSLLFRSPERAFGRELSDNESTRQVLAIGTTAFESSKV